MTASKRNVLTTVAAVTAVLFGLLTVASGGRTLFGGEATRQAAGAIVPYVLWFNFVAGFAYVVTGVALWRRQRGAAWIAAFIAVATGLVFAALGVHIGSGVAYEMRTVAAMALRTLVWAGIAWIAYSSLWKPA